MSKSLGSGPSGDRKIGDSSLLDSNGEAMVKAFVPVWLNVVPLVLHIL